MIKGLSLFFYCFVLLIIQVSVGFSQEVVSETLSNDINLNGESTEDTLIIQEQSVESIVIEETNDQSQTIYTIDTFKSYTVKQLKGFLSERGLTCHGCSEKADFIQMAFERQSAQIIPQPPPEPPKGPETSEPPENMDEIMAKLRQQGFGNSNFFNAADLNGKSPEELNDLFSGKKPKKSAKGNNNSKKNDKKTEKKSKTTFEDKKTKDNESTNKNTKSTNDKKEKTSNTKDSKKKTSDNKEKTSNKKSSTKDSKSSKKEPKESKKSKPEQPKRSFAKPIEEEVDEEIIEL